MDKIVYIIPGFTEQTNLIGYKKLIKSFENKGFITKPIRISWKNKTMGDYVNDFLSQVRDKEEEIYVFGFSFGAMIALLSASRINPKKLMLCSLSPYFKEDIKRLKKSWKKIIGKKRMKFFQSLSFDKVAKSIKCPTILLVGEKESKIVQNRVQEAHKLIADSTVFVAKGAKHNISQEEYLEEARRLIRVF